MRNLPQSYPDADILFYIEKASSYLDGLLGGVFVVPFTIAPPLIKHITLDLTVYFLSEDVYSSQKPNLFDEHQAKKMERIMKMISQIIEGTLVIGVPMIPGQTSGFDSTTEGDSIFTLDSPYW